MILSKFTTDDISTMCVQITLGYQKRKTTDTHTHYTKSKRFQSKLTIQSNVQNVASLSFTRNNVIGEDVFIQEIDVTELCGNLRGKIDCKREKIKQINKKMDAIFQLLIVISCFYCWSTAGITAIVNNLSLVNHAGCASISHYSCCCLCTQSA